MKKRYPYISTLLFKNRFVILLYLLFGTLLYVSSLLPLTFDDSVFMATAKNVSQGNYSYRNIPFDPSVTTGFPVIIPTAIVYKLLSVGVIQARVISVFYVLCFLGTVYFLSTKLGITRIKAFFVTFLTIILCLFTIPNVVLFSLTLYGDIPALFFYLLAHIVLIDYFKSRKLKLLFLTGLLAGLAFSTKYIMGVGLLGILTIFLIHELKTKKMKLLLSLCIILLGMVLPELLYRAYHLFTVGIEQFIKDLNYVFFTYHAIDHAYKLPPTSNTLINHLIELKKFNFHSSFLLLVPFSAFLSLPYFIRSKKYIFISMIIFAASIYLWWAFISRNLALKHLSIATIVFNILLSLYIIVLASSLIKQRLKRLSVIILFGLVVGIAVFQTSISVFFNYNIPFKSYIAMRSEQNRVLEFVEGHPHATFYYIMSYSTPDLAFLSSKYFEHYESSTQINKGRKNFLILSRGALKVRSCFPNPTVIRTYNFSICNL